MLERCKEMDTAIASRDLEGIPDVAQNALNAWLAARSACRRILAGAAESDSRVTDIRHRLEKGCQMILQRLGMATSAIEVPRTQQMIAELRTTLLVANAQPLIDTMSGPLPE
jgi:hypothetical protein